MSTNINLSDILKKIASDTGFLGSAGSKFSQGETLEVLFVSGGNNQADTLVLKDTSGDNYSISAQSLQGYLSDDEYNALMNGGANKVADENVAQNATEVVLGTVKTEETDKTQNVDRTENVEATDEVGATQNVESTKDADAIQKEIDKLEQQREVNRQSMETLKQQIEDLRGKIEQSIADALEAMEDIEEEQKKKAEEIVAQELKKYQNSNGEMSQDQFSANVKAALAEINPSMSEALTHIMSADTDMALMGNLLDQLSQKVEIDKQFDEQIDTQQQAKEAAEKAEQAAKCCDPIGANFGESLGLDLDGDGGAGQIQIDFFYDEDGDGKINSLDDFVGAKSDAQGQDGWSEMTAMDADGDGTITGDEMADKDVKVMITEIDADGTKSQRAMSIDEFTEQVGKGDLEINAQKHDQISNNVVGPFGFNDNANNQMLGTFDIGFSNDESVDTVGYQTLDDQNWLVENYSGNMDLESLKEEGVDVSNVQAQEGTEATQATEMTQFEEFVNEYRDTVMPQLQTQINDVYMQLGLSQDAIDIYKDLAQATADLEGQKIADELEAKEKEQLEAIEKEEAESEEENVEGAEEETVADETLEEPALDPEFTVDTPETDLADALEAEKELILEEKPEEV